MLGSYFAAGGWGMYPTVVFGFLLIAVAARYALRSEARYGRLWGVLAVTTASSGVLGCATGLCTTCRYVLHLAAAEQLPTLVEGCEESLHNLVLALIIVVLAGLVASFGAVRGAPLLGAARAD